MGLVSQVFDEEALSQLPGYIAIGHNRYSTTGSSTIANIQPLQITYKGDKLLAVGHNGNLTNSTGLRKN
jgi:amidophosphoribosyltransferase